MSKQRCYKKRESHVRVGEKDKTSCNYTNPIDSGGIESEEGC